MSPRRGRGFRLTSATHRSQTSGNAGLAARTTSGMASNFPVPVLRPSPQRPPRSPDPAAEASSAPANRKGTRHDPSIREIAVLERPASRGGARTGPRGLGYSRPQLPRHDAGHERLKSPRSQLWRRRAGGRALEAVVAAASHRLIQPQPSPSAQPGRRAGDRSPNGRSGRTSSPALFGLGLNGKLCRRADGLCRPSVRLAGH